MNHPAPRVLHIVPSRPFGGMQRLVTDIAAEQRRQSINASVLAVYGEPNFERNLVEKGVPYQKTRGDRLNILGWLDFVTALSKSQPDLVHLHAGLLWANALSLLTKSCPWVFHSHVFWRESLTTKEKLHEIVTLRICDAFIGVSDAVTRSMRPSISGNTKEIVTIRNGTPVDNGPSRLGVKDPSRPHFGMATRFAPDKGIHEFIAACRAIADQHPGARFTLAGNGPLLVAARMWAEALGLSDRIKFPGFVRDMTTFWRSLDVAIFTAPKEPFGLRIIEPMTCGTPVIAYRTGSRSGSDELIDDGITGALVDDYGDAKAMATCCLDTVQDAARWMRLSEAGRRKVRDQFSLAKMVRSINELYNGVTKRTSF